MTETELRTRIAELERERDQANRLRLELASELQGAANIALEQRDALAATVRDLTRDKERLRRATESAIEAMENIMEHPNHDFPVTCGGNKALAKARAAIDAAKERTT